MAIETNIKPALKLPERVDLTSPMDALLNPNGNTEGDQNNTSQNAGVDPYEQAKLMALAAAAMKAGNFELAIDIASLVDEKLRGRKQEKSEGEEMKPDVSADRSSAAPAPDDRSRPMPGRERPVAQQEVMVARDRPAFSQSAANEKFWEEYGKVAYDAYVNSVRTGTGFIADAMSAADEWAAKNNGAVISAGKEEKPGVKLTDNVAIGDGVRVRANVESVVQNAERSMMAALVDFKDFPVFPFGDPKEVTLKTVAAAGKERGGPDLPDM